MGYYASTRIDAGTKGTFEPGQEVTGLEETELQKLKDAGAVTDKKPEQGDDKTEGKPDEGKTGSGLFGKTPAHDEGKHAPPEPAGLVPPPIVEKRSGR